MAASVSMYIEFYMVFVCVMLPESNGNIENNNNNICIIVL